MDFPRLSPPHVYAGRWSAPGSPREFGGKSPPGAPKVRREREAESPRGGYTVPQSESSLGAAPLKHAEEVRKAKYASPHNLGRGKQPLSRRVPSLDGWRDWSCSACTAAVKAPRLIVCRHGLPHPFDRSLHMALPVCKRLWQLKDVVITFLLPLLLLPLPLLAQNKVRI
ncbi:hypothetical protein NDU88_002886 [Pleurodeles waltl]|uniref:Uncharacterized protein n=1 Tax=Pleurodeles waltl TaxID=8319 RepID=A0AAV7TLZ0_PLEWA|nr:hypothetical protein NDU88_002886 [Pleurodeles waltl]